MLTLLLAAALAEPPPFDATTLPPPPRAPTTVIVGRALTGVGLGVFGLGAVTLTVGGVALATCDTFECYTGPVLMSAGGAIALSSLPLIAAGGATWTIGARRERMTVAPALAPGYAGGAVFVAW